jgi:hypothetical protein
VRRESYVADTADSGDFLGSDRRNMGGLHHQYDCDQRRVRRQDLRTFPPPPTADTITLTQNAADVTAFIRSATTGLSCRYDGSASFNSLSATAVDCDKDLGFQCSTGGHVFFGRSVPRSPRRRTA